MLGGTVNVLGTWRWQTPSVVSVVNDSGNIAVFTTTDNVNYESVTRTITVTVAKTTPHIVSAEGTAITYGDMLSASTVNGTAQYSNSDSTVVAGSFAWAKASAKPTVADSNTTTYAVGSTPDDTVNYNTVNTTAKLTVNKAENAPNMPGSTMNVSNRYTKIRDVPQPTGWEWQDTDKETALEVDAQVTATAVHTGVDKDNYENKTVSISVTRTGSDHGAGDIFYTGEGKAATGKSGGYTGDTYCKDCGSKLSRGTSQEQKDIVIQAV